MDELISVIVPVYNVEKYLEKTITHIINQTYRNLEIILVDDGSKDKSGEICDRFAKEDSRIKVFHKENGGSSTARNVGIENATGAYIGFLDADDYADEHMYEILYKAAKENDATIVQSMSQDFDEEGNLVKGPLYNTGKTVFIPSEENFRLLMLHLGDSSFCTKLIKADFCKRFRFPEHKLNEDFLLVLKMIQEVDGIYSVQIPLYNILIHSGSNQRSGFKPELYNAIIDNSDYAVSLADNKFTSCKVEAERFFLVQRLMFLLHIPVETVRTNSYYPKVINEVRAKKKAIKSNPFLEKKERRNLTILSICPVFSKRIHKLIMKLKKAA